VSSPERTTRALPFADLEALLGVVAVLQGHLIGGELPPGLTRDLVRRLIEHGPLPEGSTAGGLNAALSDLGQRLHWAMGTETDYPAAMPHRTNYLLDVPAGAVAACVAALRAAGAENVHDGPATTAGPKGTDIPDARTVSAAFPELAPDPAYDQRVAELSTLADRHGGRYQGATW
jgi:hypothetical protein